MRRRLSYVGILSLLLIASCKSADSSTRTKKGPQLTAAQLAAIEKTCTSYSTNYTQAIKNTPGAAASLKMSPEKTQQVLKSICAQALARKGAGANAVSGTNTALSGPPIPSGSLGIVSVQKDVSQTLDQKDVLASSLKQFLKPLIQAFGVNEPEADKIAEDVSDTIGWLDNGLGVSLAFSASAAAGVMAGISGALELVYYRPTGAGEIGFYCTPGMTIGTGIGASASIDVGITKTLGCPDTHSYEGGFINFPLSIGPGSLTYSLGADGPKFLDYMDYAFRAEWSKVTTAEKLKAEMDKFDKDFLQIAQNSKDPIEILVIFMYVVTISAALDANPDVKKMIASAPDDVKQSFEGGYFRNDLEEFLKGLLRQITSFEILKTPNRYSSAKTAFQNLLTKLVPENDYQFNRTLLAKLIDALGGCDSIAFSASVLGGSFQADGLLGLKSHIAYTYAINPMYQAPTETYDRKKHVIMDLDSFKDFGDPKKWEAMASTLGGNLEKTGEQIGTGVEQAANTVASGFQTFGNDVKGLFLADTMGPNPPPCVLTLTANGNSFECIPPGGLSLAVGSDITAYTGLDNFGPLAFVGNMLNMVDPTYLYAQCLKPGYDEAALFASKVKDFFGPPPQVDKAPN